MPAISVIVPMYNAEAYVGECLESLMAQTFKDFEVIVIDDGSTDNSSRVVASVSASDARFRLIGQPNKGPSEARNTGLKIAHGAWIAFIDSDDKVSENYLETLLEIAQKHDAEIACCGIERIGCDCTDSGCKCEGSDEKSSDYSGKRDCDDNRSGSGCKCDSGSCSKCEGSSCKCDRTSPIAPQILTAEDATRNALYQHKLPDYSAWNKLYAAKLLQGKRFPAGVLFEDLAFIPEILLSANKVAVTQTKIYQYRKHPDSILAPPFTAEKAVLLDIAEDVYRKISEASAPSKKLVKAARSMLVSASFSILMRSEDSQEFACYRERAFTHIRNQRLATFFDTGIRARTRAAILLSYLPQSFFLKQLKRGLH